MGSEAPTVRMKTVISISLLVVATTLAEPSPGYGGYGGYGHGVVHGGYSSGHGGYSRGYGGYSGGYGLSRGGYHKRSAEPGYGSSYGGYWGIPWRILKRSC